LESELVEEKEIRHNRELQLKDLEDTLTQETDRANELKVMNPKKTLKNLLNVYQFGKLFALRLNLFKVDKPSTR